MVFGRVDYSAGATYSDQQVDKTAWIGTPDYYLGVLLPARPVPGSRDRRLVFFGKNCQLGRVQALSEPEPAAAGAAAACVQSVGWRASGTKSTETRTRHFWAAVAWRPNDPQHQPATTQRRQTETHTSPETCRDKPRTWFRLFLQGLSVSSS